MQAFLQNRMRRRKLHPAPYFTYHKINLVVRRNVFIIFQSFKIPVQVVDGI